MPINKVSPFWAGVGSDSDSDGEAGEYSIASDDWSAHSTPTLEPVAPEGPSSPFQLVAPSGTPKVTPQKVRALHALCMGAPAEIDSPLKTDVSLSKRKREIIKEGMASLEVDVTDSPGKKARATKVQALARSVLCRAANRSGSPIESCTSPLEVHREMSTMLRSPWVSHFLGRLQKMYDECEFKPDEGPFLDIPRTVINVSHLFSVEESANGRKQVGLHFCPPSDPLHGALQNRVDNPVTGVFSARWKDAIQSLEQGADVYKLSTFFPAHIETEEECFSLLNRLETIGKAGKQVLFRDPETGVFCEGSLRQPKITDWIYTIYPLFLYNQYVEGGNCLITADAVVPFEQIRADAMDLLEATYFAGRTGDALASHLRFTDFNGEESSPVRYLFEDQIVLEMAPTYAGNTGVEKGVLIAFPLSAFEGLEHYNMLVDALRDAFPS